MTSTCLDKEAEKGLPEDDMQLYLQQIRQFPRLTPQEEKELALRCAQGDQDAVRQMVSSNLRLVVSIARDYDGRGVPLLDLIQEGSIGLLAAARKFDGSLDYRFSTYATKWIRQGVTRCLQNHGALIRVPLHTQERLRKVNAARQALQQETGQEPTAEQIAEKAGLPLERVEKYLRLNPETCSLDAPMGEDTEDSLAQLLQDLQAAQPQEELVRQELKNTMDSLLMQLPQRQQQLLRLRFGMDDGVCHSLESIGKHLGISKERARQIERQAMDRLQNLSAGLGLEDFLNE